MLPPIQKRLDDFRRQGRVQAGSLIISVFGDAVLPRGSRIWLGSLIRLLEPLELNERLVRTSAFRLAKEEWLRTEPSGRRADYLLTPSGQRRFEEASRHIYASSAPRWDRRWRLIITVGELPPKRREALRRALFWQGFGILGGDCFVHPSAEGQAEIDGESAFLLRTLLIHDYRRLLLRDPELPDVLLPPEWPGQKARLLCKELYRRLLTPSERHLDAHFQLADGQTPEATPALHKRFREDDPLGMPA